MQNKEVVGLVKIHEALGIAKVDAQRKLMAPLPEDADEAWYLEEFRKQGLANQIILGTIGQVLVNIAQTQQAEFTEGLPDVPELPNLEDIERTEELGKRRMVAFEPTVEAMLKKVADDQGVAFPEAVRRIVAVGLSALTQEAE